MKKSTTYWTIIFHKIAQRLVEKYEIICLETLNIQGMMKNKRLARSIQEKAWHMFITYTGTKREEHRSTIVLH